MEMLSVILGTLICMALALTLVICYFRMLCCESSVISIVSKLFFAGVCGATAVEILFLAKIPVSGFVYGNPEDSTLICAGAAGAMLSKALSMSIRRLCGMTIIDRRELDYLRTLVPSSVSNICSSLHREPAVQPTEQGIFPTYSFNAQQNLCQPQNPKILLPGCSGAAPQIPVG